MLRHCSDLHARFVITFASELPVVKRVEPLQQASLYERSVDSRRLQVVARAMIMRLPPRPTGRLQLCDWRVEDLDL